MAQDMFMKGLKTCALSLGLVVFLLFSYEFMQWVNFFAVVGHELVMAIVFSMSRCSRVSLAFLVDLRSAASAHLVYYGPLYALLLIVFAIPTGVYLFKRSQWKAMLCQCENVLKVWRDQTKREQTKNKAQHQKYVDLKKHVEAAARPCIGEVLFHSDDTITLRHPFCRSFHELKGDIAECRKQNLRLTQELSYARRKAHYVIPTPETIEAMRCDRILELEGRLDRYQIEENLRKTELREFRKLYEIATRDPEANEAKADVERLQKELKEKNTQLIKSQNINKKLEEEMNDVVKERNTSEASSERFEKSSLALKQQVTDLERAVQGKDSEIEKLQQLASAEAKSGEQAKEALKTAQKEAVRLQQLVGEKDQGLRECCKTLDALKASQQTIVQASTTPVSQADSSIIVKDELTKVKTANLELQIMLQKAKQQHGAELAAAKEVAKKLYEASKVTTGADVRGSQEYQNMLANAQKIGQERNELVAKVRQLEKDIDTRPSPDDVQAAEDKHAKLIQAADRQQQLYNEACDTVAKKDEELAKKTQQLYMAEQMFKDKEEKITELNKRISDLAFSTDDEDCATKLEAALQTIKAKDQTITQQGQEVLDLSRRITDLAFNTDDSDNALQLETARKTIVFKDEQITVLEETKERYVEYSKRLDDYITSLEAQIETLKQGMEQKDVVIKNRDLQIQKQDQTIESLTDKMYDSDPEDSPILDTGAMAKNLKRDIDELRADLDEANAEIRKKDDIIARNDQSIRALTAAADVAGKQLENAQAAALEAAIRNEDLDEIERTLKLYNLPGIDSNTELSEQINIIVSRAQDAQFSYARLNEAGLVHPQNGDRLDQHVGFVISEMQRHRGGAADFYNIVVAVENELDRKFGARPQGSRPGQTALGRVKTLVNRS